MSEKTKQMVELLARLKESEAKAAALGAQVARLENELRQKKLIHVGFTNEHQLRYAIEQRLVGGFYPDTEDGCYIPLYMLDIHAHRAGPDSEVYKEHCERWSHKRGAAEMQAEAGRAGYLQALDDVEHRINEYYATTDEQDQQAADEYAEKVRKGAK